MEKRRALMLCYTQKIPLNTGLAEEIHSNHVAFFVRVVLFFTLKPKLRIHMATSILPIIPMYVIILIFSYLYLNNKLILVMCIILLFKMNVIFID